MLWFHLVWILKTGRARIGYWGIHSSVRTAFSLDNVNGQILDGKFVITFDVGANKDRCESETTTLGDLLYDSKVKAYLSEKAWVSLVQSIAAGDQLALHSLYEQMHRIVFTLIVRITNNRETAEELTVDVFHDVWRRSATYDPANGSVVGWIMNQARSRAIDRLRFERRKKRSADHGDIPLTTTAANDPHQGCYLEEQSGLLRNALQVLTPEERQVIETAFFSELTYHEVATKLNQPLGTVKTRIRSGLGKLRHALAGTLKGL
jgi:RNA polymerase sigma-70 factor, ECF subfamily